MPNASGTEMSASHVRKDSHLSIVSDLALLIERIQESKTLIEAAIIQDAALGDQEIATNVVVLDDVTPGYVKARAALTTCEAGLGVALHFLLEAKTPKDRAKCSVARLRHASRRLLLLAFDKA
ncbi:MAG TPA: hypothetical protein VKB08_00315 [Bradyrhizobium sp.]|jgi:hypothetical protein|nr:hypothetical protein [Bradyrhizobium sp.]